MAVITQEGIRVNQTLCFSVNQALLGAQLGVTYVSPFVGRLDDQGHQEMDLVGDLVSTFRNYPIETQVLDASMRHPLHYLQAAKVGAHIASVPFRVLTQ